MALNKSVTKSSFFAAESHNHGIKAVLTCRLLNILIGNCLFVHLSLLLVNFKAISLIYRLPQQTTKNEAMIRFMIDDELWAVLRCIIFCHLPTYSAVTELSYACWMLNVESILSECGWWLSHRILGGAWKISFFPFFCSSPAPSGSNPPQNLFLLLFPPFSSLNL